MNIILINIILIYIILEYTNAFCSFSLYTFDSDYIIGVVILE